MGRWLVVVAFELAVLSVLVFSFDIFFIFALREACVRFVIWCLRVVLLFLMLICYLLFNLGPFMSLFLL